MPKQYFSQQFAVDNNEKMKRRAKFIRRMEAKYKTKRAQYYARKRHYYPE